MRGQAKKSVTNGTKAHDEQGDCRGVQHSGFPYGKHLCHAEPEGSVRNNCHPDTRGGCTNATAQPMTRGAAHARQLAHITQDEACSETYDSWRPTPPWPWWPWVRRISGAATLTMATRLP